LYVLQTGPQFFEGTVNGTIISEPRGAAGFGYDPVFVPDGYNLTFAELGSDLKNSISHRRIALNKLLSSGVLSI
jgi:XTP/dITP diphosphohydrolase